MLLLDSILGMTEDSGSMDIQIKLLPKNSHYRVMGHQTRSQVPKERGYKEVEVETNCLFDVKLVQEDIQRHPLWAIIKDCGYLVEESNATITHIWREANICANFLANEGDKHDEDLLI